MNLAHRMAFLVKNLACAATTAAAIAGCSWFDKPAEPPQAEPIAAIDASDGDYHDRVAVIWDSISGAASYTILRSLYADTGYTAIAGPIDSLRFDDNSVIAGSYYYYKVAGFDANGSSVDTTPYDKGFASQVAALGAPKGVEASDGSSDSIVEISWEPVTGAAYYKVFRCETPQGDFLFVGGDTSAIAFTDVSPDPGLFYYTVSAFTADDIEGAHSDADSGFRLITNREFFHECDTTVMRSNAKISILGDFGEEIIAGDVSGLCHYITEVPGIGRALATITYTNYCDFYLIFDGSYVSDTDWGGTGNMTGTINATGIYSGTIEYHLVLENKSATGGYYRVCQDHGGCEDIEYISVK